MSKELTPQELVNRLDKFIIGQSKAKKSVSVAIRNRYRRQKLDDNFKDEVIPKNILMIGPTGVGKTEIARRLAKLIKAPFVKIEATKFTEVGYVGRNVESMVKDLVSEAIRMVEEEKLVEVSEQAKRQAENRIVDLLVSENTNTKSNHKPDNPFEALLTQSNTQTSQEQLDEDKQENKKKQRRDIKSKLAQGLLEHEYVNVEIEEQSIPDGSNMGQEFEEMGINFQDLFGQFLPKKTKQKRVKVKDARKILGRQEAQKLIDNEQVTQEAVERAENYGIIFLDEFDKIAVSSGKQSGGQDVSREGVQRDILPIVEGSSVNTKYGRIKTDHIMFIGAGAFHDSKPSDLIPELQGRFPIRVKLESLTKQDFYRILTEPHNALLDQYKALLETEEVKVNFTEDAIEELASMAEQVNNETEDIGARRLHTLLEKLLEELSFYASDMRGQTVDINAKYVRERLEDIVEEKDVSRFIL
ncbi:ATP-dependent protease ATPase subunit HslU [Natranaerobius trueperi]|uniref:ATP-dependent protease ATPase subunit HslU n=1 Tax=Natranaerobius trueperi TaxID=759412 RepID=UPI00117FD090